MTKHIKQFVFQAILALSAVNFCAYANSTEPCAYNHDEIELADDYSFRSLFEISKAISVQLCLHQIEAVFSTQELEGLAKRWETEALKELAPLKTAGVNVDPGIIALSLSFASARPGGLVVNTVPTNSWQVRTPRQGGGANTEQGIVPQESNAQCLNTQTGYGKTCMAVLNDLYLAVSAANADKNRVDLEKALSNIGLYSAAWDSYFTEARSLTPWELALNTYLYKDELSKDSFVLPPQSQWFLLHPSIVVENVSDALDGDQQKEALSLEWIGFNRWNASIPYGLSIVSTYADRSSVDDTRHGVMLHVNNSFSVGFTGIGEDDKGVFINVDLLKMLQSKDKRFNDYKNKIKEYRQ